MNVLGFILTGPLTAGNWDIFHPETRTLELRGELDVQNHVLERYEDFYRFNEDFSSFAREQIGNFSDMPVSTFNLTLKGSGKKIN